MAICVIEIKKDFAISVYPFLHPSQTVGGSSVFSSVACLSALCSGWQVMVKSKCIRYFFCIAFYDRMTLYREIKKHLVSYFIRNGNKVQLALFWIFCLLKSSVQALFKISLKTWWVKWIVKPLERHGLQHPHRVCSGGGSWVGGNGGWMRAGVRLGKCWSWISVLRSSYEERKEYPNLRSVNI